MWKVSNPQINKLKYLNILKRRLSLKNSFLQECHLTIKGALSIQTLPNFSRRKRNQTIKSGQLIKYNITNIFLEKSYTKCGGRTIPRPFWRKTLFFLYSINWPNFIIWLLLTREILGNVLQLFANKTVTS